MVLVSCPLWITIRGIRLDMEILSHPLLCNHLFSNFAHDKNESCLISQCFHILIKTNQKDTAFKIVFYHVKNRKVAFLVIKNTRIYIFLGMKY